MRKCLCVDVSVPVKDPPQAVETNAEHTAHPIAHRRVTQPKCEHLTCRTSLLNLMRDAVKSCTYSWEPPWSKISCIQLTNECALTIIQHLARIGPRQHGHSPPQFAALQQLSLWMPVFVERYCINRILKKTSCACAAKFISEF